MSLRVTLAFLEEVREKNLCLHGQPSRLTSHMLKDPSVPRAAPCMAVNTNNERLTHVFLDNFT